MSLKTHTHENQAHAQNSIREQKSIRARRCDEWSSTLPKHVQLLNIRSLVKLTSETVRAGMEWTVADVTVVGGL